MSRYTFLDTLHEIESRSKVMDPPATQFKGASASLRSLAQELRKLAEAPPPLTYEELYAVRSNTFSLPEVPKEPSSEGPGASLHKLAHDLRCADRTQAEAKVALVNDLVGASVGLTVLRDRLRSTT